MHSYLTSSHPKSGLKTFVACLRSSALPKSNTCASSSYSNTELLHFFHHSGDGACSKVATRDMAFAYAALTMLDALAMTMKTADRINSTDVRHIVINAVAKHSSCFVAITTTAKTQSIAARLVLLLVLLLSVHP